MSAAEAWLAEDPDPRTRAELEAVLADGDEAGLISRFGSRLQFGTAGLRGEMGAGPNRMNRALVRRAAAGMAAWLHQHHPDRTGAGIVVCFDARHLSREFAEDSSAVFAAAEIPVHLLDGPQPTPVLAFAVRHLGAAAGVMVTASHNPPRDNGYKVYDHTGAQIVPPADTEISAAIDGVGPLSTVELAPLDDPRITRVGVGVLDAYRDGVLAMLPGPAGEVSIVYTAMHGVGGAMVVDLLRRAGFGAPHVVAAQFDPDPEFPTVAFPNPEEPGAIDLALGDARRVGADLVLANDPDADRLAAAVPDPSAAGGWRMLLGDELGVLLADAVLATPPVVPSRGQGEPQRPLLATTIVSSQQLSSMASAAGIDYAETLTGFKWIARAPGPDRRLLFGYEEALGYCVGDLVRDKDGISALLALAQRVAALRAEGVSLLERLDQLSLAHGLHLTRQLSFRLEGVEGLARISECLARLRAAPPRDIDGDPVATVDDLLDPGNRLGLPLADVIILRLDGGRVIVRPSGTEPKLKCYLEVVRPPVPGIADLEADRGAAASRLERLASAMTDYLALT